MKTSTNTKRFDVVIYNIESRKIVAIIGRDLPRSEGFHNAEKRLETAFQRINDDYSAAIVKSKKYNEGDTLIEKD
jgi:hypothetical protein